MKKQLPDCFICKKCFVSSDGFSACGASICHNCLQQLQWRRRSSPSSFSVVSCTFCADSKILPIPGGYVVCGFQNERAAICVDCIEVILEKLQRSE